ncbi:MAG: ribonuclease R [Gammaproteobacteria bacterium]|nr:ribonuclease R [Gammaproteobacteria bacterium]
MAKKKSKQEYDVTIPERKEIMEFLERSGAPRQLTEIAKAFNVRSSAERSALSKRLKAMLRDGELMRNRREGYGLLEKMDLVAGRVIGHADGYGFFRPDHGGEDLFLSMKQMRSVLHGDHVVARYGGYDRRNRREAVIVEVLEHVNYSVVGRFYKEGSVAYVIPDNKHIHQDILIPPPLRKKAKAGEYVVAEITRQPDRHTQPVGKIVEVLGRAGSVDMATEIALRAYQIPYEWPDGVEEELAGLERNQPVKGRRDLRSLPLVTIDGEDARDFDDAVFCEKLGKEWRLVVAIADVSHYVKPGTTLDGAARERGNSVYFPSRVVPMLPELLSNDLCSLKPDTDRFAMVCDMRIGGKGQIRKYRLYPAAIRSRARLTYNLVRDILAGKKVQRKYRSVVPHLAHLHELYHLMHGHRQQKGLLDFSTSDIRMYFDDQGRVSDIRALERSDSHRIIEEFMLAANISVADFLLTHEIPCVFRNHAVPKEEKINDLHRFLDDFNLELGGGLDPRTKDYADILELVGTREDRHLIETVLLRSMPLAVYEGRNNGHFGLAFEHYTHFTSPIRRYPDLLVHRALRHILDKGDYGYDKNDMHHLGAHCSMTERRAEEAVRDVGARMKCEFMVNKTGRIYNGIISGVTGFGLFVELDDIYVEGLVHISALPADYYHFDPIAHSLSGERSGRKYFLGDRIRISVLSVNVEERKIDFDYVE